jgi:CRP/FNR family transcriptional regulator, anaerobic regulatory protein
MSQLEQYIKSYFGIIDANSLQTIASLFTVTKINKGDFFLKADTYCNQLGFVENGLFRIFAATPDKEITQWISSKGYFITEVERIVRKIVFFS